MLASVALIASGGDRYLQSAGGLSQALEQRLAARLPQPEQKDQPPADRRAAAQQRDALSGGGQRMDQQPGVNSGASEGQSGAGGFLDPGVYQLSAYPALRARLGEQIPRGGLVVIGVHTRNIPGSVRCPCCARR